MKMLTGLFGMVIMSLIIFSFEQGPTQWVVPENYQKMKNPVKSDAASIKIGKDMYLRYCKSCHGENGDGEGTRGAKLVPAPGDFTTAAFKKESDGAIFYKMTVGHNAMPSFKKKIPSHDDIIEGSFGKTGSAGDLINYIRTFAKS
jgi:mono/diheme cytochrome c family protein